MDISVSKNGKSFEIKLPDGWGECTREQASAFLRFISEPDQARRKMERLLKALGWKKWLKEVPTTPHLNEVFKHLAWLNEYPTDSRCLMPRIGIFRGPKDGLIDMSLLQLIYAGLISAQMADVAETKDTKKIHKQMRLLVACVYVPWGMNGLSKVLNALGIRMLYSRGFNPALIEFYAWLLKFSPKRKITAGVHSWGAQRKWLAEMYPRAHSSSGAGQADPREMIIAMAGDKFGTVREVERMDARYIFRKIEMDYEQAEKK